MSFSRGQFVETLRQERADLQRRIEGHREDRVRRGLQLVRPPRFVDREISAVLNDELVLVLEYAINYAGLVARVGCYVPSEYAVIIAEYRNYIILLIESIEKRHNVTGGAILRMLRQIGKLEKGQVTVKQALRRINLELKILELQKRRINEFSDQPLPSIDYERLERLRTDEHYFKKEVERYMELYKTLEKEIDCPYEL